MNSCSVLIHQHLLTMNDHDEVEDILTYGDVPNTEQGWDKLWLEDDDAITDG